ncbi:MAG: ssDNA-binding Zn-finger/Zn-ribbon topoisomerase 1 [Cryomorphaceae bacterium]
MVTKVAVKESRIGEKFLMCRKYPYCDYKLPVSDEKVLKMQKKEQHQAAKPGFGDWSPS